MQETIKLQSEIALMEKKHLSPDRSKKPKRNFDDDYQAIKTPIKDEDPYKDFLKNVSESKQSLPKTGSYAR